MDEKDSKRIFRETNLLFRLTKLGIFKEGIDRLDSILYLTAADFLKIRLQTLVYATGLSRSIHHARVLVRQGHIAVNKHKVNIPSFLVRQLNQQKLDLDHSSAYSYGKTG